MCMYWSMARKVQVQVGIEPDNLERIDEAAQNRGVSRAQFIREATRQELQAIEGES